MEVSLTVYRLPAKGKQRRGDVDNYGKSVLDSLTGVLYRDDSQVVALTTRIVETTPGRERLVVVVSACVMTTESALPERVRRGADQ